MTPLGPEAIGWLQVRMILDKCRQFVDIKKGIKKSSEELANCKNILVKTIQQLQSDYSRNGRYIQLAL